MGRIGRSGGTIGWSFGIVLVQGTICVSRVTFRGPEGNFGGSGGTFIVPFWSV